MALGNWSSSGLLENVEPNKPKRLELIVCLEKRKRIKNLINFSTEHFFTFFFVLESSIDFIGLGYSDFLFGISMINLFASNVLKNFFNFIVTITYFGSLDFDKLWEEIFSCLSSCPNEFLVLFFLGFLAY